MSKNQITALLILSSFIFLLTNLQYLPGPCSLYTQVMIARLVMALLFVICAAVCVPALLILMVVGWLRKSRRPAYKMQWDIIGTCFILPFVGFVSLYAGEFGMYKIGRELAIKKACALISSVEHYKQVHHSYPANFSTKDYSTGVMGIGRYYYTSVGDGYRITFKQWGLLCMDENWTAYEPHTIPVVMGYNGNFPTSHKYWYSYTRFN